MKIILIFTCLLISLQGFNQSDYDRSKIDFEITSQRFELIKWEGINRNATKQNITSSIKREDNKVQVTSGDATYNFEIIEASFDGIDKTTFKCKNGSIIKLIPGVYFSFTIDGNPDTEYYFGDLKE